MQIHQQRALGPQGLKFHISESRWIHEEHARRVYALPPPGANIDVYYSGERAVCENGNELFIGR